MFPGGNATLYRIYIGANITRTAGGAISSIDWLDGSNFTYGDPLASGFSAGVEPWMNGAATGGANEPKSSTTATALGILRNGNTAGGWATLAPTTNAYYICEFVNSDAETNVTSRTVDCQNGYIWFDKNCYKVCDLC